VSSPGQVHSVLVELLDFSARVGPLTTQARPDGGEVPAQVTRGIALRNTDDRIVGLVRTPEIAAWVTEGPRQMRRVLLTLAAELDAHRPVDGRCPQCGTPTSLDEPCRARRRMTNNLLNRRT
jgi:hypothetical protein